MKIEKVNSFIYKINEYGLSTFYYLIGQNKNLVIDTGTGVDSIVDTLKELDDKEFEVVATHGHVDHIGGMNQFSEIYIHPDDIALALETTVNERKDYAYRIQENQIQKEFSLNQIQEYPSQAKLIPLENHHIFDLGDHHLEVIYTPGHTAGSICLFDQESGILFSGDTCQHLELLMITQLSFTDNLKLWQKSLKTLQDYPIKSFLGGHEPLENTMLETLIACIHEIEQGNLKPIYKKVHIFEGEMIEYQSIHILRP